MTIKDIMRKILKGDIRIDVIPEYVSNITKTVVAYRIELQLKYKQNYVSLDKKILPDNYDHLADAKHELIREAFELCSAGMEVE